MRQLWLFTGIVCAVACVVVWLAFGANRGWSKTTRTRLEKDPVTEIEYPIVEKRYSPGVEMLAAGLLLSAALASISFFIRPKQIRSTTL